MKSIVTPLLLATSTLASTADPLVTSWFTERSGQSPALDTWTTLTSTNQSTAD